MTRAELHHLVDDLPDDSVDNTMRFVQQIVDGRIDADQLWFWTPEWQAKEREVEQGLRSGDPGTIHMSDEIFLAALRLAPPRHARHLPRALRSGPAAP